MNSQLPNDPKTKGARPAEKISPQNTKNTQTEDRTPNGDTSRGVDEGAIEIGTTGKRGQFGG